jgi:lipopolysaccharide biosynthesis glycosyltransferase
MESIIMHTWKPSFPELEAFWQVSRHTVGAYFRLFLHRFLPSSVEHVLYIDTDLTILANLEALWQIVEARPDALFHWVSKTSIIY